MQDNFQENNNTEAMEKLRKELRMTRIFSGITSVLLICTLIGGFLVFSKVREYAETAMPLAEKVSAVEFDVLNETMGNLNETLNEIDWEKLSQQLEALDMEALNEAIAGLNTEELSEALGNLNDVVQTLENFSGSIKDFFSKLGVGGSAGTGSF